MSHFKDLIFSSGCVQNFSHFFQPALRVSPAFPCPAVARDTSLMSWMQGPRWAFAPPYVYSVTLSAPFLNTHISISQWALPASTYAPDGEPAPLAGAMPDSPVRSHPVARWGAESSNAPLAGDPEPFRRRHPTHTGVRFHPKKTYGYSLSMPRLHHSSS